MNQEAFGKIFESLYSGSMIGAGEHVFALWPYCIAHVRPPRGMVEVNPRLVASVIGTTPANIQSALDFLCAPDLESRSKLEDGKRLIREGQFLYRMVNFPEYRKKMSAAAKAEYQRLYMADYRRDGRDKTRPGKHPVNAGKEKLARLGEAEAEAEANSGSGGPSLEIALAWLKRSNENGSDYKESELRSAFLALSANGWMWGRNAVVDWRSALERQIQTDRQRTNHGNNSTASRTNPRNVGIIRGPTDYKEAAQRKQRQQEEDRALAQAQYEAEAASREAPGTS